VEGLTNYSSKFKSMTVLDVKRSNNVAIGLSRFNKRFSHYDDLIAAVQRNDAAIEEEDLLTIFNLLPVKEEKDKLSFYETKIDKLGKAEQFMIYTMREPYLEWMCSVLVYERSFEASYEAVSTKLGEIVRVFEKLRSSHPLKLLLKTVLELGNLTNYQYGRGGRREKAMGFKLDGLVKLKDVKGKDNKTNLLNYLASAVEESNALALLLPAQFSELNQLRFYNMGIIGEEYTKLQKDFDHVKMPPNLNGDTSSSKIEEFRRVMLPFVKECTKKLENLTHLMDKTKADWITTAHYFGEEAEERQPEELFSILDQFFKAFGDAIKINEEKRQREKRKTENNSSGAVEARRLRRQQLRDSIRSGDETIHGITVQDLLKHEIIQRNSISFSDLAISEPPTPPKHEKVIVTSKSMGDISSKVKENDGSLESLPDTCELCKMPIALCECQF
jgi:hypothetical protein